MGNGKIGFQDLAVLIVKTRKPISGEDKLRIPVRAQNACALGQFHKGMLYELFKIRTIVSS